MHMRIHISSSLTNTTVIDDITLFYPDENIQNFLGLVPWLVNSPGVVVRGGDVIAMVGRN